jgi:phospholipid transport system transporter-binding protein
MPAANQRPTLDFDPQLTEGCYRLRGELTFATVTQALKATRKLMERGTSPVVFDFSGIRRSDSAGVALLIEWQRMAASVGRTLRYTQVPHALNAIMRVSGVVGMLPLDTPTHPVQPLH